MPGITLTMQPFFESEEDLGKQIDTRATWSFHIAFGEETLIHTKKNVLQEPEEASSEAVYSVS